MTLGWRTKFFVATMTSVALAAVLVWAFVEKGSESTNKDEKEQPKGPSPLSAQSGQKLITIDRASQIKSGIALERLKPTSHREQIRGYGSVLQIQELVDLYNSHLQAKAQLEKARASLDASKKEYERLKQLRDNRNISDKTFQTAEAAWMSDEVSARSARESLLVLEGNLRQRWGPVLARWMEDQSPSLTRLIRQEDILVQVTVPPGENISVAPPTISLQTPEGKFISAGLVSPSPHADPRIQGISYFYLAKAREAGLVPGINVSALLPAGSEAKGVVVPSSAVVWWEGKAWIYVQPDQDHFFRKEISTDNPVKEGWFISNNLSAGDQIVVSGTQLVLSQELRAEIPSEQ